MLFKRKVKRSIEEFGDWRGQQITHNFELTNGISLIGSEKGDAIWMPRDLVAKIPERWRKYVSIGDSGSGSIPLRNLASASKGQE